MTTASYILGIVASVIGLAVVIELLRRGRLRERHAIWWVAAGLLALVAAVFPVTVEWAAGLLGVQVPTNLIFFVTIVVLFFVCLQTSTELTLLEQRTRTLAERTALLELRIRDLEGDKDSSKVTD